MVIDGKKLAFKILYDLKYQRAKFKSRLRFAAVLVGKDPASISFLNQKRKAAEILNIDFKIFQFSSRINTSELKKEILKLNRSKKIQGIIIQLPLPKHIDYRLILNTVAGHKDVDALSGKSKVLAPTIEAVKFIFKKYRINFKKQKILVVGKGELVGQPISNWLSKRTKLVEVINEKQKNTLSQFTKGADIIISGVGKAGLIKGSMVKPGAILIDFGFNKKNNQIYGDFDFESVKNKAKLLTPVPGGMGPITVVMLFKNFLKLIK